MKHWKYALGQFALMALVVGLFFMSIPLAICVVGALFLLLIFLEMAINGPGD